MADVVIGFAGLTHLGIVSAAAAAIRGFDVIAFDSDADLVSRLARGDSVVIEPGLAEALATHGSRIRFSSSLESLADCDIIYVSGDVPTASDGTSDLGPVRHAMAQVQLVAAPDSCVVILSQVPPGFSRGLGGDGRLYYQVETLVFGRALDCAVSPERFIVGVPDPTRPLDSRLKAYLEAFGCPVLAMRYESAELAKISINAMLVASLSAANTLAEICEAIGADWSEIVPSLRLDRRIGPYSYIEPGLGIAGGNLERDLATIVSVANEHATDSGVVRAWLVNSSHRRDWVRHQLDCLLPGIGGTPRIAVWGLAYKENTHSVKNSVGVALVRSLPGGQVTWYDPVVRGTGLGLTGTECASAAEAATDADVLCIMTPWPEFREVPVTTIAKALRGRIVIDPYRVLQASSADAAGLDVRVLGRSQTVQAGAR